MTTDNEYSDMGLCPECLADGYDGISCSACGHIGGMDKNMGRHNGFPYKHKQNDNNKSTT